MAWRVQPDADRRTSCAATQCGDAVAAVAFVGRRGQCEFISQCETICGGLWPTAYDAPGGGVGRYARPA
eukprot:5879698-Prymnesium_polylepis.1